MKVALVGDVAVELLAPYFREAGMETYVPAGFGTWRQEMLDRASPLNAFAPDRICDVTAFDGVLAAEVPGFYDERMRQLAAMPYSLAGIRAIVEEFQWSMMVDGLKVLAVDADNTLWRGILSEDGRDALHPCRELQQGLASLAAAGVVLVLLTKNDPPAAGAGFMRSDMPLQDGDVTLRASNWAPKAGNLLAACRRLNLSIDSVVFLDDNPFERAQMFAHLPQVAIAPWTGWPEGGDIAWRERQLVRRLRTYCFAGVGATEEDRLRNRNYRARLAADPGAYATPGDYLEALGLYASWSLAAPADCPRLAQMAGKTNQFNATTIRRSEAEFRALIADGARRVYVFRAGDRYGEMGIVCYVVLDCARRCISDFVMSCRAMGRTLEHFAYATVCADAGYRPAADFTPTAKNAPFAAFLASGMSGRTYYRQKAKL